MATNAAVAKEGLVIPLIDFSKFLTGTCDERKTTAEAILHGFQTAGFIYLKNHPIPADVLSRTFARSADFFALDTDAKMKLGWTTPEANRGYSSPGREKVTQLEDIAEVEKVRSAAPDLKESLEIGRDTDPKHPNQWPTEDGKLKGFRTDMNDFFSQCQKLHVEVMRAIALGMDLQEDFFNRFVHVGDNTLRLLHYPSVKADVFRINPGQVRAGEHSDYGSITLLFQDSRGGLQVKSPTGYFVDATPIPGTIVVNAGDLLARWSNDTIKSTIHRVVEPPRKEDNSYPPRYSIAEFLGIHTTFKIYKDYFAMMPKDCFAYSGYSATNSSIAKPHLQPSARILEEGIDRWYLAIFIMGSSQDANRLAGCPGRHIDDFFTRNALDYQTRNQCLRFAQLIFPEELVGEADTQGECSYTVAVSTTHLLQFRPGRFSLDMEIYKDARRIFKHLISETTYLGPFSGIPAPRSPHINPPLLHVYLMDKVPGVTLSGILQIHDAPNKEFRHNLVQDMAAIFAKSYHHRVPSRRRHTLPAGKGIQGRIGSSLRWRANLLTSIADAKLSQEAQATKYHLGHIERLPWCLTHGDLIPSNIMVDPQTGHITGLLDWAEGEWLPLGIGMYAIDECLGQDDAEKGFVYFDDHAELRVLFWRTFLGLCEGHTPARNGVLKLSEVEMARRLGLLLWRGIAFDDGRLDRLVEAGRDDGELKKLRVLLDAPSLLESISTP